MDDPLLFDDFVSASGMRVYHQYRPLPWFGSMLIVWAGSRHTPVGMEELAHLTEHMLSCGTRGYPYDVYEDLERCVAQKGWYFDAGTTDLDGTRFELTAPAQDVDEAMEFLDAFVRRPRLRAGIRREIKIVAAERLARMSADQRKGSRDRYMAMYGDPHFASMPSWTDTAPLDNMTLNDVRTFHEAWFECPNMTLLCVGGVPLENFRRIVERRFPARRAGYVVPECPHRARLRRPQPRTHVVRKARGKAHSVDINCHWLLPPGQGDGLGLTLHGIQSLLLAELRTKRESNYEVETEIEYFRDHRALRVATAVTPEMATATRRVFWRVLRDHEGLIRHLAHYRKDFRNRLRFRDLSVDQTLEEALESLVATGLVRSNAWFARAVDRVSPDDVRYWLTHWFRPNRAFVEITET